MTVAPNGSDRRAQSARVPFEALIEIAAPKGTRFEAESVDISAAGMHLRTAYLPEVGTPIVVRFESSATGKPITVRGEVVWAQDQPEGAEFGVRFRELASTEADLIRQIVSASAPADAPRGPTPVRIHIEGVSSPMRAQLRADSERGAIVGSELKMLRLGSAVELEDKGKSTRRPAKVDAVDCQVDPETNVPHLVVRLRYEGEATVVEAASELSSAPAVEPSETARSEAAAAEAVSAESQSVAEPVASAMPPAVEGNRIHNVMNVAQQRAVEAAASAKQVARRVGNTVLLLLGRKIAEERDVRRTTAPLGVSNRQRTLRQQGSSRLQSEGEAMQTQGMQEIDPKKVQLRKRIALIAAVVAMVVLAFVALRKPKQAPPVVAAPAPELSASVALATLPPIPSASESAAPPAVPPPPPTLAGESTGMDAKSNPNPFGNTTLKRGERMTLRLDGPIGELRGTVLPNGFVVGVPNRQSRETASQLAVKDKRIASAKVSNRPGVGAELTVTFHEQVPDYVVRAKGDALELVIARDKAVAKKGKVKGATPKKDGHPTAHVHKKK